MLQNIYGIAVNWCWHGDCVIATNTCRMLLNKLSGNCNCVKALVIQDWYPIGISLYFDSQHIVRVAVFVRND